MSKKIHYLKTVNPWFTEVFNGNKRSELRKNDRDFKVGDEVYLQEYNATAMIYSGRIVRADITFVLDTFPGIVDGYCIFCFKVTQHIKSSETTREKENRKIFNEENYQRS